MKRFTLASILDDAVVPVYGPGGRELKVYDSPKYARIVERFQEDGVRYVIVMFNHPSNPPSNDTRYLYLAP